MKNCGNVICFLQKVGSCKKRAENQEDTKSKIILSFGGFQFIKA